MVGYQYAGWYRVVRRRKTRGPEKTCPKCHGTGYLDGPKVERVDSEGKIHVYTSLSPCLCYTPCMTTGKDHAQRAAGE